MAAGLSLAAVSRPLALALIVMLALLGTAGCGADKEARGGAPASTPPPTRAGGARGGARGVVARAKQEIEAPGPAGSQFFVVVGPDAQLPAEYALVGRVTSGMDTVDRIAVVPTDPNTDRPLRPVVIDAVRVVELKKR